MVESRPFPLSGGMADRAVLREACGYMIGIGGSLKRRTMTTDALGTCSGVDIAAVALQARHTRVGSSEWETCPAMIKLCTSPLARCMTNRAILRETCGDVIRISSVLERGAMTGNARRTRSSENPTHVTLGAIDVDMGSCQGKASLVVFKLGATPLLRGVASLAIR